MGIIMIHFLMWFQLWWWLCNLGTVLPHYKIWASSRSIFWWDFSCDGYYTIWELFHLYDMGSQLGESWYSRETIKSWLTLPSIKLLDIWSMTLIIFKQPGLPGDNLMTCSICDDLYISRCEIAQKCGIWRGLLHIWPAALAKANTVIITQNGTGQTSFAYGISYIIRTGFSCRFRIWSQNSSISSVWCVIGWFVLINGMKDQFMYSKCSNG